MRKIISKNNYFLHLSLLILTLLCQPIAFANDDDYLSELQSEVDSVVISKTGSTTNPQDKNAQEKQKSNMASFEKKLSNSLPATYHAYKRLNPDAQADVVSFYFKKNQDMTATTRHLFSLYFSSKNKHQ